MKALYRRAQAYLALSEFKEAETGATLESLVQLSCKIEALPGCDTTLWSSDPAEHLLCAAVVHLLVVAVTSRKHLCSVHKVVGICNRLVHREHALGSCLDSPHRLTAGPCWNLISVLCEIWASGCRHQARARRGAGQRWRAHPVQAVQAEGVPKPLCDCCPARLLVRQLRGVCVLCKQHEQKVCCFCRT